MMLALCTAVTFRLLFIVAYSNAYSAILLEDLSVITFSDSTTPGTTSCSRPLYSPSVFSLTIVISSGVSPCLVSTPGMEKQWTRFT